MALPLLLGAATSIQAVFNSRNTGTTMVTFDLREKLIPFSLLQITNVFRRMHPGEEMEILAGGCPVEVAIFQDVMRILPRDDYDLISREKMGDEAPVTRLRLRKKLSVKTQ